MFKLLFMIEKRRTNVLTLFATTISQSRVISSQRQKCANLAPVGTSAYESVGNRRVNGNILIWTKLLSSLRGDIKMTKIWVRFCEKWFGSSVRPETQSLSLLPHSLLLLSIVKTSNTGEPDANLEDGIRKFYFYFEINYK